MKIFIDTADIEEIKEMKDFIDGVTTNPSLISKEDNKFQDILLDIAKIIQGPISAEVISLEKEAMLKEARELARIAPNIVIKLPLTEEGLKACFQLSKENIKTNITLCFSPNQALLAAKAKASYVSPFIGRLDDLGQDGPKIIKDIIQIYDNYQYKTEVIAASIRHPLHVLNAAKAKAHIATIPYKIIKMLFKHPLTDKGIAIFTEDWNKRYMKT